MAFANASETRLAFVTESAFGVTPATPTFQNLRFTGESLNLDRENVVSNEIRPDRNVPDLIQVGGGASGGFDFELSYGTFDTLLESVMQNAWNADVLKNGITPKFLTLEKTFELGATDSFIRYTGMAADTLSLNCAARQIVTGSFGFMGKGGSADTSIISGATYTDATTTDVLDAASSFANLTVEGVSPSPRLMSVALNITNNLRMQPEIGAIDTAGIGSGRFEVTGTIEAYFETNDLYSQFLAGTGVGLSFTVGKVTTEKYTIECPRIKFETAEAVAGGNDTDVMVSLGFRALYDAVEECSLIITREVA